MKKILFLIIVIILSGLWFYIQQDENSSTGRSANNKSDTNYSLQENHRYTFVPYWTFEDNINTDNYDSLIYFGVTLDENGIGRSDQGYSEIDSFIESVPEDKNKYLTLRIIGDTADGKILEDRGYQEIVGEDLGEIASEYGFDGVVVDYETSAFGFASTEQKITDMYKVLENEINNYNLDFLVTLFGDAYYRARPYNVKEISSFSDKVLIMTYDFHKARLNPGPNFPLSYKEEYGYNLKNMISDFREDIAHEKMVIVLGYFGYNWTLTDNDLNTGMAQSLSLNQIRSRYINSCPVDNCEMEENDDLEKVIRYTDQEGNDHEVWFEDEESAEKKIEFLKEEGINQIASWAHSYY